MRRNPSWPISSFSILLSLLLVLVVAGCSDETTVNVVSPDNEIRATVSGRVISYPAGTVIADATIDVSGQDVETDFSAGVYRTTGLGAGNHDLIVSAPGHAASRVGIVVAGSSVPGAQDIHVQRDVYLLEASATLAARVSVGTGPAEGAVLDFSRWTFPAAAISHEVDFESLPASVDADSLGNVAVSGLPATTMWVTVAPHDQDGDGTTDYFSATKQVQLRAAETANVNFSLRPDSGSLEVIQTNLTSGFGAVLSENTMTLVFSTNMNPATTRPTLSRSSFPSATLAVTAVWVTPYHLELTATEPFEDGLFYGLTLAAESAGGVRRTFSWSFGFESGGNGGTGDCPDFVTDLRLAAHPPLNYDSSVLGLEWTAVACAGGYNLFARNDANAPSWIYLKTVFNDLAFGTISTSVTLPSVFDLYAADQIQTPFAGTEVTLGIVPLSAIDPAVDSGHGQLTLRDTVPPLVVGTNQLGSGMNSTASNSLLEFFVFFDEYVDPTTMVPTIQFVEAGGDPGLVLDPADAVWSWENGGRAGRFQFTLAPGADASGDQYQVMVTDLTDFSGNTSSGTQSTGLVSILPAVLPFDFEGSPQGWTVNGAGWEWGTPTVVGPPSANSGASCFGTDLDQNTSLSLHSTLTSPPLRVPVQNPQLEFWAWSWFASGHGCKIYVNGQLVRTMVTNNIWHREQISLMQFFGQIVVVEFVFESGPSSSFQRPGVYIDDVQVVAN